MSTTFLFVNFVIRSHFKDVCPKFTSKPISIFAAFYNELLCQHKKIHRFKVYKLYSLFVFQFIALEGFIHFVRYTIVQ